MSKEYVGIADCHGVESFMPLDKANLQNLTMRAFANDQRHAVVYKITLNEAQIEEITDELETAKHSEMGDGMYHYKQIVRKFKTWSDNEAVTKGLGHPPANLMVSNKKMWKKIPNSKLDPWR